MRMRLDGAIKNSTGNLFLHIIGNLNTYIGAGLGKSGYTRNRELEFSLKDIPKTELLMMIEQTTDGKKALIVMNTSTADQTFNIKDNGKILTTTLPAGSAGTYVW